jgi:hypothetical protein
MVDRPRLSFVKISLKQNFLTVPFIFLGPEVFCKISKCYLHFPCTNINSLHSERSNPV